jgi:oligosaccharide repeat unit polymerase
VVPVVSKYLWPFALLVIVTTFVVSTSTKTLPVTAPLWTALVVSTFFYWVLWRRRRHVIPWFELGAVYVAALTLYTAYPLVGFLAIDGHYAITNDVRLWMLQPSGQQVGAIAWLYVSHLGAFVAAYLIVRGRLPVTRRPLRQPSFAVFIAVGALYLAIQGFIIFVGLFYDMSANSYLETYLVQQRLPLLVAQVFNHLSGMKHALTMVLLAALFSRYPRSQPVIIWWIVITALITVTRFGSRTELVLLIMASAMMYQLVVRPLSLPFVLAVAGVGLIGFIAFGILRSASLSAAGSSSNPFSYASEFEILMGNAIDLAQKQLTGSLGVLPDGFHLADFTGLVPQQLAPFKKVDPADWYVHTFYPLYAAQGGGLAFGTIAEAVLTGGWMSAAARGAALGFCFAKIHRFYEHHASSYWVLAAYVWLATLSYQSFRNRTFVLLLLFVYRFLPVVIMVKVLVTMLNRSARQSSVTFPRPFANTSS